MGFEYKIFSQYYITNGFQEKHVHISVLEIRSTRELTVWCLRVYKMAARWSAEHVVAEYRDLQANSMALDCTGQYAVIAGKRCLIFTSLDKPSVPIKKVYRNCKWDITIIEWNPHQQEYIVLAYNQSAELLQWKDNDVIQVQPLQAHTRSISDLNWSSFDANVLATASIDTFIHLWDLRDPKKPVTSLSAVAGASQVKWNKVTENIIATAHEGEIRLWDPRKSTSPVQYISAHLSKIHSLDWSPIQEHQLATSSQDCSVKFWDVTNPRRVEGVLDCDSPVWRARYTPFGDGLVTVVVPPLRRGENNLMLWNISNMADLSTPVHTFVGHSDVVMEFAWRKKREDSKEYQLVTWSKDQSLRIWTVDLSLQRLCGLENFVESDDAELLISCVQGGTSQDFTDVASITSQMSPRETEAGNQSSPPQTPQKSVPDENATLPSSQPENLQQEFSLVNLNIPNITIDEMDVSNRTCIVTALIRKHMVRLKINFPSSYPYNASPIFHFCKSTTVDSNIKTKLLKVLRMTSQQQVKRNRTCLEPCLRQLVASLESSIPEDMEKNNESPYLNSSKQQFRPLPTFSSILDVSVPFPRTTGAKFCGADFLVVFVRPAHLSKANVPSEITPRSLSAFSVYCTSALPLKGRQSQSPGQYALVYSPVTQSPSGEGGVSISTFYRQDRKQKLQSTRHLEGNKRRILNQKVLKNCESVLIYSIAGLMAPNYFLAENYVLNDEDIATQCTKNASKAAEVGRRDLVQMWSICSHIANPKLKANLDPDIECPWAQNSFGRKMLQSIIEHYIRHYDVQTAAMLCCMFGKRNDDNPYNKRTVTDTGSGSQHSGKWWLKVCQ
ncbi:GATOR complex protein WDR59-like isoform X1 [Centruroides sculpturatus]|uniref:GATOR complex protein WDR59-like isoform X1 n=2 Tax=Centruroides sculpturatus TaxID=218467 RepID=UPI000C6EAA3F|nr:GATOR complex protein WDR59-like isoform X1 [Centruroides sculpturatus]